MDHGPVGGGDHRHLVDGEVLHHRVQGRRGAAPAGYRHGKARLVPEGRAAGVEGPVQGREQPAGGVGVVDRRAKDEAVGLRRLLDQLVDAVILEHAGVSLQTGAAAAAAAVPDRLAPQLEDLCLDPLGLQCISHL